MPATNRMVILGAGVEAEGSRQSIFGALVELVVWLEQFTRFTPKKRNVEGGTH